jgi:hypothetical protein
MRGTRRLRSVIHPPTAGRPEHHGPCAAAAEASTGVIGSYSASFGIATACCSCLLSVIDTQSRRRAHTRRSYLKPVLAWRIAIIGAQNGVIGACLCWSSASPVAWPAPGGGRNGPATGRHLLDPDVANLEFAVGLWQPRDDRILGRSVLLRASQVHSGAGLEIPQRSCAATAAGQRSRLGRRAVVGSDEGLAAGEEKGGSRCSFR